MCSVNRATFVTANMSLLLLSVPRAIVQPASRRAGMGALTPRFAAMAAWCEMMVPESPSNAISVSSTYRGETLGEAFTVPRPEFRGWVSPQGFYSDSPPRGGPGRSNPLVSAGRGAEGPYVNEAASTTDVSI